VQASRSKKGIVQKGFKAQNCCVFVVKTLNLNLNGGIK
jgi:hypothetical protein